MSVERRLYAERLLRGVRPVPVVDVAPAPRAIAEGLWVVDRQLALLGLRLPARMTVVRLPDGGLFLHSPVWLDAAARAALDAWGEVRAIVAPNSFHYRFAAALKEAYPRAELFLAPGLAARRPELPPGTVLGETVPPAWSAVMDQLVFGPVRGLAEVVFFHRPTATLLLTDLVLHVPRLESLWERFVWRWGMGVGPTPGPSRTVRLTLLSDRAIAVNALGRIAAWPFERVVMTHGEIVERGGRAAFRAAYAALLAPPGTA